MDKQKIITVKVEESLWRKSRSQALLNGKTMTEWIAESLELRLKEK